MTTQHEPNLKILCAGCLEWFAVHALKVSNGHPYCVHCYPSMRVVRPDTKGERVVAADMMRRRP